MKIVLTVKEIFDLDLWQEFCDLRGVNEWAINEGLLDYEEEFSFTKVEARKLGLPANLVSGSRYDDNK